MNLEYIFKIGWSHAIDFSPIRPDYSIILPRKSVIAQPRGTDPIFGYQTLVSNTDFYGLGFISKEFANFQSTSVPKKMAKYFRRNFFENEDNLCTEYDPEEEGRLENPFEEDHLKIYVKQTKLNGTFYSVCSW